MRSLITLILISFSFVLISQEEKRLALVIGNASYEKGVLKNPVNDAELVAKTLDSLNFDVILKKNLEYRSQFVRAIREFGQKRAEYDVAFVYYAGHGIQVDNENFLLPTKEEFLSEDDVLDFGVSVQNVLRYLESESEKVNILILDACRDNPFEVKWNATRSLKGSGLAKIPPPTGSLIAFSTDAGSIAADGEGVNSIYSKSLCKNLKLKEISIDQVFRNVRSDVLKYSGNKQRPVESSQLTGKTYYINRPNITTLINKVDKLFLKKEFYSAKDVTNNIIKYYPDDAIGYCKRAQSHFLLNNFQESTNDFFRAYKLNNFLYEIYHFSIFWRDDELDISIYDLPENSQLNFISKTKKSLFTHYKDWLNSNRNNAVAYWSLSNLVHNQDSVILLLKQSIDKNNGVKLGIHQEGVTSSLDAICYLYIAYEYNRSNNYSEVLKYNQLAIKSELLSNPNSKNIAFMYSTIGDVYYKENKFDKAISYHKRAINLMPSVASFYKDLGQNYDRKMEYDSALFFKNKALELYQGKYKSFGHYSKSLTYILKDDFVNAFDQIVTAMTKDSLTYEPYLRIVKAFCYMKFDRQKLFCQEFKKITASDEIIYTFKKYFDYEDFIEYYERCN